MKHFTRNRIAAGVFALVWGALGIHDFYLGNTKKGIWHIVLAGLGTCWVSAGIVTGILPLLIAGGYVLAGSAIWALVDGIRILSGRVNKDASGNFFNDIAE